MMKRNMLLLVAIVIIVIIPLIFNSGAEYGGADGEAEEMITEIQPSYEPWYSSIYEPPSGEIESLLFVLQGVIGAAFIGYFIGYMQGKSKKTGNELGK